MCVRELFRMRNLLLSIAAAGLPAFAAEPLAFDANKEARFFLLRYVGLTSTSDVAALDLYRDDARVRVASYTGDKETQLGIVQGKDWKQQLRAGWYDGSTRLEAASFQGATVLRDGDRLVIRARRYSQTNCYWDDGYAVVITPDAAGQFQIVEERINFQRASTCSKPGMLAGATASPPVVMSAPAQAAAGAVAAPGARLPSNVFRIGQGALRPTAQAQTPPAVSDQPPSPRSKP
jgi:hypothetical protein